MQPEWRGELGNFLDAINPICKEEWTDKGVLGKIYLVVKVCIYIPVLLYCGLTRSNGTVKHEKTFNRWFVARICFYIQVELEPNRYCTEASFVWPACWQWFSFLVWSQIQVSGLVKLYILVRFATALLVCSCSWRVFLLCMVIWLPTDGAINLTSEL